MKDERQHELIRKPHIYDVPAFLLFVGDQVKRGSRFYSIKSIGFLDGDKYAVKLSSGKVMNYDSDEDVTIRCYSKEPK